MAAIAALIGEPEMAIWDATTEPAKVLDGRIPESFAISAITGSMENTIKPVPAMIVITQVVIGAIIFKYLGFLRINLLARRTK
ncbi:hypothetical protein JY98_17940 [Exiguobacterium mexicanum]|nr:hypothetical protein JY98_17940 [Exiguobacterium mexicanum]